MNKTPLLRIGVIGYGYWGPNLVRSFAALQDAEVACVCDLQQPRREHLGVNYPQVPAVHDWRQLVADPSVDAVVVATPVSTHYAIAREALGNGKHVLVEKPLTVSSAEAAELIEMSRQRQLTLMVGHTFVYQGAVRKIREIVRAGELGEVLYIDSTRANFGILQDDINVVWDLAPHDISIMDFVLDRTPLSVSATGASHTTKGLEEVAFLTFYFPGGLIAHVNVSWLAPIKIRRMIIGGTRRMLVYDDLEAAAKLKIYDCSIELGEAGMKRHSDLMRRSSGDAVIPELNGTEALLMEARDFVGSIRERRPPVADGESGLRVVRLLELASRSLAARGAPVEVGDWHL